MRVEAWKVCEVYSPFGDCPVGNTVVARGSDFSGFMLFFSNDFLGRTTGKCWLFTFIFWKIAIFKHGNRQNIQQNSRAPGGLGKKKYFLKNFYFINFFRYGL